MFNPYPPGGGSWFTPTGGYTPQPSFAGSPYGSQPYAYGQPQSTAAGAPSQPNTGPMTPQQYLEMLEAYNNSPMGQAANRAIQQTIAKNLQVVDAQLKAERDRIAISRGQVEADLWYRGEQIKLAQKAHQLAVQTQQQNYELAAGGLTGMFQGSPTLAALGQQGQMTGYYNGAPTLANLAQQAQYTGLYGGTPTLQAIGQQQQFGLQQGALMGNYQGNPTLQAIQNEQNYGLNLSGLSGQLPGGGGPTLAAQNQQFNQGVAAAGLTGQYQGSPTLAAQNQFFNQGLALGAQTGYQNGQATLPREQAAAGAALQAAQLGASLRGPGDWAQYLQAANAVAGSPVSALVASAPGGLGAMQGDPGGPMTLAKLWSDYGVMPGQGATRPGGMVTAPGLPALPPPSAPGGAPLSAQEQARFGQLVARQRQVQNANPADNLDAVDLDELARFMARGAVLPAPQMPQQPVVGGFREPMPADDGPMFAGGTPTFDERTGTYTSPSGGEQRMSIQPVRNPAGSYSAAPAGGMRRATPVGGGGDVDLFAGRMPSVGAVQPMGGGAGLRFDPTGGSPDWTGGGVRTQSGYNPYSMTGALGQAARPWQPTAQQLGFNNDDEMNTVKGWLMNPNQAPVGWLESKSKDQRAYLGGLNEFWGGSNNTFMDRYANSRTRQQSPFAAV